MRRVLLTFNDATKQLPEKSDRYIVLTYNGDLTTLDYSAKYKAFNAMDYATEEEVERWTIKVTHWANVTPSVKELIKRWKT